MHHCVFTELYWTLEQAHTTTKCSAAQANRWHLHLPWQSYISFSLSFCCIVMDCLSDKTGSYFSQKKHSSETFDLVLATFVCHSKLVSVVTDLFLALSSFVLLNMRVQLWRYFVLHLLKFASILLSSSNQMGSNMISKAFVALNWGTFFAITL